MNNANILLSNYIHQFESIEKSVKESRYSFTRNQYYQVSGLVDFTKDKLKLLLDDCNENENIPSKKRKRDCYSNNSNNSNNSNKDEYYRVAIRKNMYLSYVYNLDNLGNLDNLNKLGKINNINEIRNIRFYYFNSNCSYYSGSSGSSGNKFKLTDQLYKIHRYGKEFYIGEDNVLYMLDNNNNMIPGKYKGINQYWIQI